MQTSVTLQKIFTTMAILTLPALLSADTVVFKSGMTREGRVEDVFGKPKKILLITSTGKLELNRSLISRVDETDDPTDYVVLGDQYLQAGSYSDAIRHYERALQFIEQYNSEGKTPAAGIEASAREGLSKANAGITSRRQQQVLEQQQENASMIEQARELITQQKFEQVERMVEELKERNPTPDQASALKILERDLYLAWGVEREDKLDRGGAEIYYSKVLELDPNNQQAEEALLRIWERQGDKNEELIQIYESKLKQAPNDVELNRKLADLYLAENEPAAAITPLKRIIDTPVFRSRGYEDRLKNAYRDAAYQKANVGDLDAGITMMRELQELYPTSDPSQLYLMEYRKARKSLPGDDFTGRSKLLADLWDKGLQGTAISEANKILNVDPGNERALAIIKDNAETELADIEKTFNEGQYLLAANMASSYGNKYSQRFPQLVQKASDLYNKAELEAARLQKERREQARDIVAQADNYAAEARRNIELFKSADNPNRSSVVSYKSEARRYSRRAINAYETALQIDPSLGPLQGGLDVNTKLDDVERLYRNLSLDAPDLSRIRPQSIDDF